MLPNDLSKFRISNLLVIMVASSIAAAIYSSSKHPNVRAIAYSIVGFIAGLVICFVADSIDNRKIDQRRMISKSLSVLGAITILGSALFGLVSLFFATWLFLD